MGSSIYELLLSLFSVSRMKERKPFPVFFSMDEICAVCLLYAAQDRLSEIWGQETGLRGAGDWQEDIAISEGDTILGA